MNYYRTSVIEIEVELFRITGTMAVDRELKIFAQKNKMAKPCQTKFGRDYPNNQKRLVNFCPVSKLIHLRRRATIRIKSLE